MGSQLLETEGDPLFVIVKVKYYYIELLVKLNDLLGMVDPAP